MNVYGTASAIAKKNYMRDLYSAARNVAQLLSDIKPNEKLAYVISPDRILPCIA